MTEPSPIASDAAAPPPDRRRRYALGALLVLALLLLAIGFRQFAEHEAWIEPSDPALRREVEKRIAGDPVGQVVMPAFRQTFPDRYQQFVERQVAVLRAVRTGRITRTQGEESFAGGTRREISALVDDNRRAMAHAPDGELAAWARSVRDLVATMQRDAPDLCAGYAFGLAPTAQPTPPDVSLAGARLLVASLHAARAGLDNPVGRDLDALPGEVSRGLRRSLGAVATPAIRGLLADPRRLRSAPPAQQCAATVSYYSAIAALPDAQSAAVIAFEMAPAPAQ